MVFIVLRHGQSVWNKQNILAGWTNVPLSSLGKHEATEAGKILKKYNFDYVFTSKLDRAIHTVEIMQKEFSYNFTINSNEALNERHYGDLTGKNREDVQKIYTPEQVFQWRSTYYGRPPNGENLHDVKLRVGKYFDNNIHPLIQNKYDVLMVSHSNSLRSLFVHLNLKDEKNIEQFEITNCIPIHIDLYKKMFWYETEQSFKIEK